MDQSSLIVAVVPITTMVASLTGIALPFIAARQKARSPEPDAEDAPAGYLYVPCVRTRHHGHPAGTRRWVQEVPIVKKTVRLIYYASDSWDRRQAVVSPGCISREQFEADTLCHDGCPAVTRGFAAGALARFVTRAGHQQVEIGPGAMTAAPWAPARGRPLPPGRPRVPERSGGTWPRRPTSNGTRARPGP
jgi:hypothetical protein